MGAEEVVLVTETVSGSTNPVFGFSVGTKERIDICVHLLRTVTIVVSCRVNRV